MNEEEDDEGVIMGCIGVCGLIMRRMVPLHWRII